VLYFSRWGPAASRRTAGGDRCVSSQTEEHDRHMRPPQEVGGEQPELVRTAHVEQPERRECAKSSTEMPMASPTAPRNATSRSRRQTGGRRGARRNGDPRNRKSRPCPAPAHPGLVVEGRWRSTITSPVVIRSAISVVLKRQRHQDPSDEEGDRLRHVERTEGALLVDSRRVGRRTRVGEPATVALRRCWCALGAARDLT
jgi:hypothetical protein